MNNLFRAFIAIEIPMEIQKKLDQVIRGLRQSLREIPIRWVKVDHIHLTLKFLGDVSFSNKPLLEDLISSEAKGHHTFDLSIGELGAFPNIRRANVIWVAVTTPIELIAVQHGIETQTTRLGYTSEDRPFSPHLTLGRVGRTVLGMDYHKISEVISNTNIECNVAARVDSIKLFKSDLKSGGSVYTCLYSAPLISLQGE